MTENPLELAALAPVMQITTSTAFASYNLLSFRTSSAFIRPTESAPDPEEPMAKKPTSPQPDPQPSNTIKDPAEWTTGDEPMTGAQQSYLHTLATEAGETIEDDLTKAEASKRINELQEKTGRRRGGGR
jgi:hypothetical protein